MADNSKYPLGFDLFEVNHQGNDVTSWPALAKAARFVYVRASIGTVPDTGFVAAVQAAKQAGLLVGAYHEAWPSTGVSAQVRTLSTQIQNSGVAMDLPTAVAFEAQDVKDPKSGKAISTWPNPKDYFSFFSDLFSRVILYTNEEGLKMFRSAGVSLAVLQLWYANYNLHQGTDGEMDVDAELAYLTKVYGILKSQVLFFQTADALPYPDPAISPDKGADYDRAVSFVISPTPEPAPTDWEAGDAKLEEELVTVRSRITVLETAVFQGKNPSPPAPPPVAKGELWTVKTREELGIPHDGSFNAVLGHGQKNALKLGTPELEWIFSIKGTWFGWLTDNAKLDAWAMSLPAGKIYTNRDRWPNPTTVDDPVILCGSTNFMRQQVNVVEWSDDGQHIIGRPGRVARIAGVQHLSSAVAYAATYNPSDQPWKFAWAFTDFKTSDPNVPNGGGYGASHTLPDGEALVFVKPLFDPASSFDLVKGTIPGFWVMADGLKERIG